MRLSLHRTTTALRRTYTGEHNSTAMPATHAILCELSAADRENIKTLLESDFGARLLGTPELIADAVIRAAVLPDAATHRQHELEGALLLALGRVHTYHSHDQGLPRRALCRRVHPRHDGLTLTLSPHTLAAVLAEILPREDDGDLRGLAGLRFRLHHRHVELYLADADPQVTVLVGSISQREFAAALAFTTVVTGSTVHPTDEPAPLSEAEQLAITLGTTHGPIALQSAVLRRFGLFREADWTAIDLVGTTCLRIDWAAGPTPALVAQHLTHPIAGLPDDVFTATSLPDGTILLGCAGLGGVISLRRHTATPEQPRTDMAWQAFTSALNRSKPTAPPTTRRHQGAPA
jgi:hypothetical protein